jgi:hypothetical protein
VLGVVGKQRGGEVEHLVDARVGDAVEDGTVLASCVDESAPAQAGQVVGDLGLRFSEPRDQVANPELTFRAQRLEDTDAERVTQATEQALAERPPPLQPAR